MDQQFSERLHQVEPDHELLDSLRTGNAEGIAKLFDRYAPAMLGLISRMVADRKKAEDLLQSAFIRMCFEIHTYDPAKMRLFTWMLNVARKTALDSLAMTPARSTGQNTGRAGQEIRSDEKSVGKTVAVDLVYLKGQSLGQAAQTLRISEDELKKQLRMELLNLRAAHGK